VNWRSTKFILTAFILLVSATALFAELIEGGTWIAVSTLVLGVYASADVAQKRKL
jgi:hypothetical protein